MDKSEAGAVAAALANAATTARANRKGRRHDGLPCPMHPCTGIHHDSRSWTTVAGPLYDSNQDRRLYLTTAPLRVPER
ncbi:hypothetical protein J1614_001669 [Plenodomus biglobosus]|nr:hypothetical protein J1614_001669 [Plenodomus biglobosus]